MGYNDNYPVDSIQIKDLPGAIRQKGKDLKDLVAGVEQKLDAKKFDKSGGQINGRVVLSKGATGGLAFPNDSYGGSGDRAAITLEAPQGNEATELTLKMANDSNDIIHFKVPHNDGVQVNGNKVWHAGNDTEIRTMWKSEEDIIVKGEADTYYPVVMYMPLQGTTFEIYRSFNWSAPDSWYTDTHKGSLQLRITGCAGQWGGTKQHLDIRMTQRYSKQLANIAYVEHGNKVAVWLRGGGARYRFKATEQITPAIYLAKTKIYDHQEDKYDVYIEPTKQIASLYDQNWGSLHYSNLPLFIGGKPVLTATQKAAISDYAEYFESVDGSSIPSGYLVAFEGDKIRKARVNDDYLLGVVSKTAGITLGGAELHWQGQYLSDKFGAYIYEEIPDPNWNPDPASQETEADRPVIKVKQENPDYDPQSEYIKRSERPEWNVVALTGQVYLRIDNSVEVGDFIEANDQGIATKLGKRSNLQQRWKVIKISEAYSESQGYGVAICMIR